MSRHVNLKPLLLFLGTFTSSHRVISVFSLSCSLSLFSRSLIHMGVIFWGLKTAIGVCFKSFSLAWLAGGSASHHLLFEITVTQNLLPRMKCEPVWADFGRLLVENCSSSFCWNAEVCITGLLSDTSEQSTSALHLHLCSSTTYGCLGTSHRRRATMQILWIHRWHLSSLAVTFNTSSQSVWLRINLQNINKNTSSPAKLIFFGGLTSLWPIFTFIDALLISRLMDLVTLTRIKKGRCSHSIKSNMVLLCRKWGWWTAQTHPDLHPGQGVLVSRLKTKVSVD